jgi:hypothetical protein
MGAATVLGVGEIWLTAVSDTWKAAPYVPAKLKLTEGTVIDWFILPGAWKNDTNGVLQIALPGQNRQNPE